MNREIDNYLLYKNLPSIDIHGEDRVGAKIKIEVFILLFLFYKVIEK